MEKHPQSRMVAVISDPDRVWERTESCVISMETQNGRICARLLGQSNEVDLKDEIFVIIRDTYQLLIRYIAGVQRASENGDMTQAHRLQRACTKVLKNAYQILPNGQTFKPISIKLQNFEIKI